MRTNVNVEETAKQRLCLQSVQKNISSYCGILFPTLDKFKDKNFLTKFSAWSPDKQKQLLIELGGPANYGHTRYWMNGLILNLNKQNKQKENHEKNIQFST